MQIARTSNLPPLCRKKKTVSNLSAAAAVVSCNFGFLFPAFIFQQGWPYVLLHFHDQTQAAAAAVNADDKESHLYFPSSPRAKPRRRGPAFINLHGPQLLSWYFRRCCCGFLIFLLLFFSWVVPLCGCCGLLSHLEDLTFSREWTLHTLDHVLLSHRFPAQVHWKKKL